MVCAWCHGVPSSAPCTRHGVGSSRAMLGLNMFFVNSFIIITIITYYLGAASPLLVARPCWVMIFTPLFLSWGNQGQIGSPVPTLNPRHILGQSLIFCPRFLIVTPGTPISQCQGCSGLGAGSRHCCYPMEQRLCVGSSQPCCDSFLMKIVIFFPAETQQWDRPAHIGLPSPALRQRCAASAEVAVALLGGSTPQAQSTRS